MDKELELRKLADELDIAKAKASQFAKVYFNLSWNLIHRHAFPPTFAINENQSSRCKCG